jgi:putative ABC transport system permease protein
MLFPSAMLFDLRYALRSLAKAPAFAAIAIAALALGIGASTSIFSVLRALILRPFSYPESDRVVEVWQNDNSAMDAPDFFDLFDQTRSFEALGAYTLVSANLGGDKPQSIVGVAATDGVLKAFGVAPALGRWILPSDEEAGAPGVIVLSHALWRQAFAGDPSILGRTVRMDGSDRTVIGVMPRDFEFASPWMRGSTCQIWMPLKIRRGEGDRGSRWMNCVGRLKPGVSAAQATADAERVGARLAQEYPNTNSMDSFIVRPMKEEMTRYNAPYLWMLFGSVGVVLLLACANVASMLLARGAGRQAEFGMRLALGASRVRILRLVFAESVIVALAGSGLGILLADVGIKVLAALGPTTDTRREAMGIDGVVLAFAVGVAALTALLAGLPPALASFRLSASDSARLENRSVAGSKLRFQMLRLLIVAQVIVAFSLVNLGALFSESYFKVLDANRKLMTENVVTAEVTLNGDRYANTDAAVRYADALAGRASALPGVTAAGITSKLPLEGGQNDGVLVNDERFDPKVKRHFTEVSGITPGYFAAVGLHLLKGRTLQLGDRTSTDFGVVVNRRLADECWPGRDPIGMSIRANSAQPDFTCHVVGVVEDVRQWGPKTDPNPEIYWPMTQAWGRARYLVVRSAQPASGLASLLREQAAALDPDMPLSNIRTLGGILRQDSQSDRAMAQIVSGFMACALCLLAVGLYGTLSYTVFQRTREIGIRMAVGAERRNILGLVFGQGFAWIGLGVAGGILASLALAAVVQTQIWGLRAINPAVLALSTCFVAAVAAVAVCLPALRAARVDPMVALRAD